MRGSATRRARRRTRPAPTVLRIGPDGLGAALVAELPASWIPTLRWGNGVGGWESDVLYVTSFDDVYALEMNISGKPQVSSP